MKRIMSITMLLLCLLFSAGYAQKKEKKSEKSKKERREKRSTYPEGRDLNQGNGNNSQTNQDVELLGNENKDAEGSDEGRNNYKDNRPTGLPNNTTIEGGSNRHGTQTTTSQSESVPPAVNPHSGTGKEINNPGGTIPADESTPVKGNSTGDNTMLDGNNTQGAASGSASTGSAAAEASMNQSTNTPSVIEHTSSQSGSAAVRAPEGNRDGTNTMQSAKPNMVGADPSGVNAQSVDVDEQTRNSGVSRVTQPAENNTDRTGTTGGNQMAGAPDNTGVSSETSGSTNTGASLNTKADEGTNDLAAGTQNITTQNNTTERRAANQDPDNIKAEKSMKNFPAMDKGSEMIKKPLGGNDKQDKEKNKHERKSKRKKKEKGR